MQSWDSPTRNLKRVVERRVVVEKVSEEYCCYKFASCVAAGFLEPQRDWVPGIGRSSARSVWKTSRNTATSHAIDYCPFCGTKLIAR